ncbi:hypothetical protein ACS0TY_017504 [Phlomoides rotata]
MGCCLSAGNHHPDAEHGSSIQGAPPTSPPGLFDEEAVKEVLLETSIVLKTDESVTRIPPVHRKIESSSAAIRGQVKEDKEEIVSEVSEMSEICIYAKSLSNETAQGKEDEEEDGVVNQRPPPRKRRAHGGGRGRGGRIGARRMAPPTPEKKGQVAPLRPVRERPVAAEENGRKRDAGEDTVKRSRSPEADAGDVKIPIPTTGEFINDVVSSEEAETLENPVVSLECFIFL